MREIIFRAWHKKERKMYKVDEICFECDKVKLKGLKITKEEKIPMADVQLMQYTNLKDQNGRKIYEGDILNLEDEYEGDIRTRVVFYNGAFGTLDIRSSIHVPEPLANIIDDKNATHQLKDDAVIGNIYENPELLKKEVN